MANPAGKAILTVLGVFGSMVGFTGFFPNEFPNKEIHMVDRQQQAQDSMVRVVVALNGVEGLAEADGPIPGVVAFDENRHYVGASDWSRGFGYIGSGGYADIWVSQRKGPGRQATYLQILGHDDGICIAYISQLWADGTPRGWLGDMGKACGKRYYYSNVVVGNTEHRPYCTWLNRDAGSDGSDKIEHNEAAAMQIYMEAFTNFTADYNTDPSFYCREPAMLFRRKFGYELRHKDYELDGLPDSGRIRFWYAKDKGTMPPKKRSTRSQQSSEFDGRLVTSVHEQHSAIELCKDDNSYGPDFVSYSENVYCDMGTKEHWALCNDEQTDVDCYDMTTHSLISRSGHVKRGHVRVENWD